MTADRFDADDLAPRMEQWMTAALRTAEAGDFYAFVREAVAPAVDEHPHVGFLFLTTLLTALHEVRGPGEGERGPARLVPVRVTADGLQPASPEEALADTAGRIAPLLTATRFVTASLNGDLPTAEALWKVAAQHGDPGMQLLLRTTFDVARDRVRGLLEQARAAHARFN